MSAPGAAPRATTRLRLRARLALGLFLLAGLGAAIPALVALVLVERTFEQQLEQRLDQLLRATDRELDARAQDVDRRLAGIEETLRTRETDLLEKLLTGRIDAGVRAAAGRMMRATGLDVLEFLDDGGRILSSGHWEEQAGHDDPVVSTTPAGEALVRRIVGRSDETTALTVTRRIGAGARGLQLHGGFTIGDRFLDTLAGTEAAVLVDGPGNPLAAGGRGPELDPASLRASLAAGRTAEGPLRLRGRDGGAWVGFAIPLGGPAGPAPATLVLVADREGLEALVRRLRWSFLLLGGLTALGAALAGVWIAGRITRPVGELVRSVDAIARGEADYTFPRQPEHELDELVESFSRLHRSLAEQQHRALAAERVAAWREVARRVAHEIKNPLAPIRLTVENLLTARRRAPEEFDTLFEEGARTILEEVEQLRRMVTEFSEFARLPEPRPRPTDVDRLVDSIVGLYAAEPGIELRRTGGGLPPCTIDEGLMGQAVKNVVQNAVEAMGESGGVLEVETAADGPAGVAIRVSDGGPGFSPEALDRALEPYFTTKPSGTGLGMAIAWRIVGGHGGSLSAENRPGGGAVVTLRFPLRSAAAPAVAASGE